MKINLSHILFIWSAIVMQAIVGIIFHNPFQALVPLMFLFVPCADRQFGNGRKYHYIRQGLLIIGAVVIAIFSL